jgi:hypothetical protein
MHSSVSDKKNTGISDDAVSMALRRIYELYGGDLLAFFQEVSRVKQANQPPDEPREAVDVTDQKLFNRKR